LPEILTYLKINKRCESCLFITQILSGSQFAQARCFAVWDVLKKVNNQEVKNLKEFRAAVKLSKKTGYLQVEAADGSYAAVPVSKIIEQEDSLAQNHFFTKSELLNDLGN